MVESDGLAEAIKAYIEDTVAASEFNRLGKLANVPVADTPLVGFADGYDSLMDRFKEVVSPEHMTPVEAWQAAFPGRALPRHMSVVAFVLPLSLEVRRSNRAKGRKGPSCEWVHAKAYTEAIINQVHDGLVRALGERGFLAVAPTRLPAFHVDYETQAIPMSNWSHRHYCYAAGLGTFGLSRSLITSRGTAHRCGSIIVGAGLPPFPRPASHTADCPHLETGGCGDCIARCPAGAITPQGKDNRRCKAYLDEMLPLARSYVSEEDARRTAAGSLPTMSACGLCQTGVPCEGTRPPKGLFRKMAA